jgi:hypothetical protein
MFLDKSTPYNFMNKDELSYCFLWSYQDETEK